MKIGVLTSSRADYGIYLALLERIKIDSFFNLEIIAFGTHLSLNHGYTLNEIENDGYSIIHKIPTLLSNDNVQSIATSYGLTCLKFADFWNSNEFDLVFCLGDRFEMNAAVQAGIPFGVNFAHIHGGEVTLGAIDNIYRYQISFASKFHFVATQVFKDNLIKVLGTEENIYNVGSLSLSDMDSFEPIPRTDFFNKFDISENSYILVTFHPETVDWELNYKYAQSMCRALSEIAQQQYIVITMPNADTLGSVYRKVIESLKEQHPRKITTIENFGKQNYFLAMYYSAILLGNTSSGIIEAASFGKYVVNVGDRQKGRFQSDNILNSSFEGSEIVLNTKRAIEMGKFNGVNVYFQPNVADNIINIIKRS